MDAAVIGCGKFGYFHAEKYAEMDGVKLVGLADVDEDRGSKLAMQFRCDYSSDYKVFGGVDLVSIATPNATHYEIAKFFIEQGVDILIEKPMTESHAQLHDLVGRAKFKQVRLWGGFLERYNSVFRDLEQDRSRIEQIYAHRSCEYRECRENEDVVFDLMIHDIFLALTIFGPYLDYKLEVERHNSISNCNDFVRAKIEFENGDKADLTARRDLKEKTKLFCSKLKGHPWKAYDLKKKGNDTLREELTDFVEGRYFHIDFALQSLKMAEKILK
jgi:predicted dehydrogenase